MKKYSQTRSKREKPTFNVGRILLLCLLLMVHLLKTRANESLLLLQSTRVSINLINKPLTTLFKTLEKESEYVFFFKDDVLRNHEKVTVKANNESVVSILDKVLPSRNLGYTVKGKQVVIVNLANTEDAVKDVVDTQTDYKVSGKVVDANGVPLPGVNITLPGTNINAITDLDGAFSVEVKGGQRVLFVVSYIGFNTKKIWVTDKTGFLKIKLEEGSASLNEVVVVNSVLNIFQKSEGSCFH